MTEQKIEISPDFSLIHINERVCSFELQPSRKIVEVQESCDKYYCQELTKEDLDELINGLQKMRALMLYS